MSTATFFCVSSPVLGRIPVSVSVCVVLGVLGFALPAPVPAQTAPAPRDTEVGPEVVELSAFEVTATRDDSYGATNSASITGTRKDLDRIPVSAEILSRAFMDDIGLTEFREILEFAAGTGGQTIDQAAGGMGGQAGDGLAENLNGQLRGLGAGMRLDGFLGAGASFDNFSKDRVELVRGPQSLLYGATNVSGIIVLNLKRPNFSRSHARGRLRVDDEGSWRVETEINAAVRTKSGGQLAVLMTAFKTDTDTWRDNIGHEADGIYASLAWRPSPKVTFRLNYERLSRVSTDTMVVGLHNSAEETLALLLAQGRAGGILGGALDWENVESLATDARGQERFSEVITGRIEAQPTRWLSLMFQMGYMNNERVNHILATSENNKVPLYAPEDNPTGEWAVNAAPRINEALITQEAYRALASITLPDLAKGRHELAIGTDSSIGTRRTRMKGWFEVDPVTGDFVRTENLDTPFSGRNATRLSGVSNIWVPLTTGAGGTSALAPGQPPLATTSFSSPLGRFPYADTIIWDGKPYRLDYDLNGFPQFVTPDNPHGFPPVQATTPTDAEDRTTALFASLSSEWLEGRFDTLLGYRYDWLDTRSYVNPALNDRQSNDSYMAGLNYHVNDWVTLYTSHAKSFQAAAKLPTIFNTTPPASTGTGDEYGVKFNALNRRLSGSIAYYKATSRNSGGNLATEVRDIVDPGTSINSGRHGGARYVFDQTTEGMEIFLTAAPARGWRIQAAYTHIYARQNGDCRLPLLYNDQFSTITMPDGKEAVAINGQPAYVPANPTRNRLATWDISNPDMADPSVVTPLTLDLLREGFGTDEIYKLNLNPVNGRILSMNGFLDAQGRQMLALPRWLGPAATGVTGLPLAAHNLGFVPSAGYDYLVQADGEQTTGYPTDTFTLITSYRVSTGPLKGLTIGGNFRWLHNTLGYWYIDTLTNPARPERRLFRLPDRTPVGLTLGYTLKLTRRLTWQTQLNINNLLDEQDIAYYRDPSTGALVNARLNLAPRSFVWTNTLTF
jgi:outer membrane receptor for ferric coprogen and ferric-rhodotorulic acid